ncbi:MAG: phosphate/phosphite/phosphonate ABC transporter substrate-binding protein [Candidatus Latescibacteria bacterium]|nr:phosphate/phosphite/phosphonate ABC transporter substrate-binding protein [Candidatus Latescibacterota bacterium]
MTRRHTHLALLLLAGMITAPCSDRQGEPICVDLSRREAIPAQAQGNNHPALRFAVSAMTSPAQTFADYQDFIHYVGERMGWPVVFKQRKTYQEINDMLSSGDLDAAFVCSGAYVRLKQHIDAPLIAVPVIDGKPSYRSYILVRRDSRIETFGDLQGRRFAFTDPLSNTGKLYPIYRLELMGWTPERFFGHLIYTYSHDHSIQAVAQGTVDGAAVDGLIYDFLSRTDPDRVAGLKVIERSALFGAPPIVASPDLQPELRASLQSHLLRMSVDSAGAAILRRLRIDRFVAGDERDYDGIRKMFSAVERLP